MKRALLAHRADGAPGPKHPESRPGETPTRVLLLRVLILGALAGLVLAASAQPRGRQFTEALAPDRSIKAVYRDRNIVLVEGDAERPLTTDGSASSRVKYGSASWVYGEELGQNVAMGWCPASRRLWFYRFDESQVPDFYTLQGQVGFQNRLDVEAYPKAGQPNPRVDLFVYDRATRRIVRTDAGTDGPGVGHYVYGIRWSPDGSELWFHRTDRLQKTMEFCAADPETGRVRVIVRESRPGAWTENLPRRVYLDETEGIETAPEFRRHMLWLGQQSGFRNLTLVNLDTGARRLLTRHRFPVERVVRVDFAGRRAFYTAFSAENPYFAQLHVVGLDSTGERRLTDGRLNYRVEPDGDRFRLTGQSLVDPPRTFLIDAEGRVLEAAPEPATEGALRVERLIFPAADGTTPLYGRLVKPPDFDPSRRYPVIVEVYAGPEVSTYSETYRPDSPWARRGYLVASFAGRGSPGRGRAFEEAIYRRLGQVEIDDQAAGIRALLERPYVDGERIGVVGHSYGGYAALMLALRYPDLVTAAVAGAAVTDWRHYDTIYTERYMGLPEDNRDGYEAGSALTYVDRLRARLLVLFGTADDNVHPNNSFMLIDALRRAGKEFDVWVGPDGGHGFSDPRRIERFFREHMPPGPRPTAERGPMALLTGRIWR